MSPADLMDRSSICEKESDALGAGDTEGSIRHYQRGREARDAAAKLHSEISQVAQEHGFNPALHPQLTRKHYENGHHHLRDLAHITGARNEFAWHPLKPWQGMISFESERSRDHFKDAAASHGYGDKIKYFGETDPEKHYGANFNLRPGAGPQWSD